MTMYVIVAIVSGLAALALAAFYTRQVLAAPQGNDRMVELSTAIQQGAMAFLRREGSWVSVFVAVLAVLIGFLVPTDGFLRSGAYVVGAALSFGAGFVGMRIATAANARTTEAARQGGIVQALPLAFRGGAVMGFTVAGFGIIGVAGTYLLFAVILDYEAVRAAEIIAAMGLGGSSIALFARVGGGIYTKAADVGADLVGKIEAGIPEDDPRNPAVIADNVGDNVGDVAGMGADLFESYVGSLVAPIAFAAIVFAGAEFQVGAIVFPLAVGALGMFASIIGSFLVKPRNDADLAPALHRGTNFSMILAAVGILPLAMVIFSGNDEVRPVGLWVAVVVGLAVGFVVGKISEIYTSDHHNTVKDIAKQAETGPATVILAGIAAGKAVGGLLRDGHRGRHLRRLHGGRLRAPRAGRHLWRGDRRHRCPRHLGNHDCRGCVRPDCRQRGRDRRDGPSRPRGAGGYRRSRLPRQHHRCRRQRFRHRFCGGDRSGAVHDLHVCGRRRRVESGCHEPARRRYQHPSRRHYRRLVPRCHVPLPLRGAHDQRCRAGGFRHDRRSTPAVP